MQAKRRFAEYASDHLTLVRVFDEWQEAKRAGRERAFCRQHFLSPAVLRMIEGTRRELRNLLASIGFVDSSAGDMSAPNGAVPRGPGAARAGPFVVAAVLCAGLYPNVARVEACTKAAASGSVLNRYFRNETEVFLSGDSVMQSSQK